MINGDHDQHPLPSAKPDTACPRCHGKGYYDDRTGPRLYLAECSCRNAMSGAR